MSMAKTEKGVPTILATLGHVYEGIIERDLEALPPRTFARWGTDIFYKDLDHTVAKVFDLELLDRRDLALRSVFGNDGIMHIKADEQHTVFVTRTPEDGWMRIWVPLKQEQTNDVKALLEKYGGLHYMTYDVVATLPIQINGTLARELWNMAVYFELNVNESAVGTRFPAVNPRVEEFAKANWGKPLQADFYQPELPDGSQ